MPEKDLITKQSQNIIIYTSPDGKASVALYAKEGTVWMNQKQIAELFATSVPNVSMHISNILKERELDENSVIKDYLTTADDGIRHQSRDSNGAVSLGTGQGIRQRNRCFFLACY